MSDMASINKLPNGKWRARYRDSGGREHARHKRTKAEAQRWLDEQTAALVTGTHVDPARARTLVRDVAAAWLTAAKASTKTSTHARYEGLLRIHVLPAFGDRQVSTITTAQVEDWIGRLKASGLSASSVRHCHRVLALVLGRAVKDRMLPSNPAQGVDNLPSLPRSDKRFLTHEQVAQLAAAAGESSKRRTRGGLVPGIPGQLVVLMLAYTGMRFGELAALRVRRVDLMRRRLEVVESASEVAGVLVFGAPKSKLSRRSIAFPRFLVDDLAQVMAGRGPDDLVFTTPSGTPLRLMNFRRRVFDPAAKAAGLEGLTPHELRHTAAALAIASGATVKDVQAMLGHASAAMTLDVYAGLFEDSLDAVADRMEAAAQAAADSLRTGGQVVNLPGSVSAGQTGWGSRGLNPGPTDYEASSGQAADLR